MTPLMDGTFLVLASANVGKGLSSELRNSTWIRPMAEVRRSGAWWGGHQQQRVILFYLLVEAFRPSHFCLTFHNMQYSYIFLLFRSSNPRNGAALARLSGKYSKLQFQKHPTVNSHAEHWQFAGRKGHQRQSHFSLVTWCDTWLGEFRLRLFKMLKTPRLQNFIRTLDISWL